MTFNPLIGPPPSEVPLPRAPLVRVIAQIHFPLIASIEKIEFIGDFQESIRGEYPTLRQDEIYTLLNITEEGMAPARPGTVWRFHDGQHWRVSLSTDFLALETSQYPSRAEFFARFGRLLQALERHLRPRTIDRLGVRYIDRITPKHLDFSRDFLMDLRELIQPALLGPLAQDVGEFAQITISEGLFQLPEERGQLRARWGQIPAGRSPDPHTLDAIDKPSWLLDFDAFRKEPCEFVADLVREDAIRLAERVYSFFRWSVTEHFLEHFGGTR